ncbi:superoxide dismutase family protein [Streptomyces sp. NPDC002928]|uniref:superoxide dismutase family protein n=1 Tax=Streptomyces sp. NPDC002928 TaxID=3154440 RepID=UPI0033A7E706
MLSGVCAVAVAAGLLAAVPGAGDAGDYWMRAEARFAPPTAFIRSAAVTYEPDLVPAASWIRVSQRTVPSGATTVELRVSGVRPGHEFGVQVHRRPCGADPAAAGGRYQHVPGGGADHVSAANEVWLDFTANGRGAGLASVRHDWGFRQGEASSVVIQDAPGAGGVPVACFTVPFGWVAGTS